MNVDFNNLRKKTCLRFDSLTKKLNRAIIKDFTENNIIIHPDEIRQEMDDLRMLIGTIASVYIEGMDNIKDVFVEVYPDDKEMLIFDPEGE